MIWDRCSLVNNNWIFIKKSDSVSYRRYILVLIKVYNKTCGSLGGADRMRGKARTKVAAQQCGE
jgi:hypothetical protein